MAWIEVTEHPEKKGAAVENPTQKASTENPLQCLELRASHVRWLKKRRPAPGVIVQNAKLPDGLVVDEETGDPAGNTDGSRRAVP